MFFNIHNRHIFFYFAYRSERQIIETLPKSKPTMYFIGCSYKKKCFLYASKFDKKRHIWVNTITSNCYYQSQSLDLTFPLSSRKAVQLVPPTSLSRAIGSAENQRGQAETGTPECQTSWWGQAHILTPLVGIKLINLPKHIVRNSLWLKMMCRIWVYSQKSIS